jgi:hypothetical protein
MAVFLNDGDRDLLAADVDASGEQFVHLVDDEIIRFAERRERAGLWRNKTDLDGFGLRERVHRQAEHCGAGERATGLNQRATTLESFGVHDFSSCLCS